MANRCTEVTQQRSEAVRGRFGKRQDRCGPSSSGKGGAKISVDQRGLDEAAAAIAVEILADPRHAEAIESVTREIESEAARLDLAIAEAERVAEALADRLGRGELTLSRYDIAIRPLDERIAKLKAERAALGGLSPQRPPRASREHWQRRWAAADQKERRNCRMALRGRRLIIVPAGAGSPAERADVTRRIRIEEAFPRGLAPGRRWRRDALPASPPQLPAARSTAATWQPLWLPSP